MENNNSTTQNKNQPQPKPQSSKNLLENPPAPTPEPTEILKTIQKSSYISLALFVLAFFVFVMAIRSYCDVGSSWLGQAGIAFAPISMIAPMLAIIVMAVKNLIRLHKYRKIANQQNSDLKTTDPEPINHQTSDVKPNNSQSTSPPLSAPLPKIPLTLTIINILEVPILILVYIIGLNLRIPSVIATMRPTLDEHFPAGYEILAYCENVNEGGGNSSVVQLKLSDYENPVSANFDWRALSYNEGTPYEDNYKYLKQADKLNYRAYVDELFGQDAFAAMTISDPIARTSYDISPRNKTEQYRPVYLNILLPTAVMQNKSALRQKLTELAKKYGYLYENEELSIHLYFADEIDPNLKSDYYAFLDRGFGACVPEPNQKILDALHYSIIVHIEDDQNVQDAIDKGFNNAMKYNTLNNQEHYDY